MTELPAGLDLFRDQLRDAAVRDLARRPRRRAIRTVIPAAGLAAAAVVVFTTGGAPAPSADAAIMRHVIGALTAPPATILHERAIVTVGSASSPYELWIESNPPHAYRVIKWGHEGTGTGGMTTDPAAELRALVASGHAHVDTTTTLGGVPAYRLSVSGATDRFLNGTAYVAQSNYYPLEIDTAGRGEPERIAVQTYEYLPASAANLALVR
jgi:hypothetical protein